MKIVKQTIKLLLVVGILLAAVFGYKQLKNNKPEISRKKLKKITYLVTTEPVKKYNGPVYVNAMGAVVPNQQISLRTRVGGTVIGIADQFQPGGFLNKNSVLLNIDPVDYALALQQAKQQLQVAESALMLEKGRGEVARREWEMLADGKNNSQNEKDLALRIPQLRQVQANVASARAATELAQLNLDRTNVKVPFNCVIISKNVDLGANVSVQESVAAIVGTDQFWVSASIPQDQLKWLDIPNAIGGKGSIVHVEYGDKSTVNGYVTGMLSKLEDNGQMARVLIAIDDPLNLEKSSERPPLLLGSYISASIKGNRVENVIKIPRQALRNEDEVWIAMPGEYDGEKGYELSIRKVNVLWRDVDLVMVSNSINEGELLVTSGISSPISGMMLRVESDNGQPESTNQKPAQ